MANTVKLRIGPVLFSYVTVWKARAFSEGDDPKYSVRAIIKKSDKETINKIRKAIKEAEAGGQDVLKGKKIKEDPLRDGDQEDPIKAESKKCYYMNLKSTDQPSVVRKDGKDTVEVDNPKDFYSGCFGYVTLTLKAFNMGKNVGVGAYLNNILVTEKGPALTGRTSAEEDFGDLDIEDNEEFDAESAIDDDGDEFM